MASTRARMRAPGIKTGTVTGSQIAKNRRSGRERTLLQVRFESADDVQTVEYYAPAGDDGRPANGSRVAVLSAGPSWKIAIAADDKTERLAEKGERRLYSTDDSGDVQAVLWLHADGTVSLRNPAEDLRDILDDFFDALINLRTFGSPSNHQVEAGSVTELELIKQRLQHVFVEG